MSATDTSKRAPYLSPADSNVATLPDESTSNARQMDKLELVGTATLIAFDKSKPDVEPFKNVIEARFYMSRSGGGASPVYCALWISARDGKHFSGRGGARGYGYHKPSAAFDEALGSAGVKLQRHIDGCGSSAVRVAMHAIACACGYSRLPRTIHTTGGVV